MTDPSRSEIDAHLDALDAAIRKAGYAVQAILPGAYDPPFAYTIGLGETLDHPEIVVVGLGQAAAQDLLRLCVERIRVGERLESARVVEDFSEGSALAVWPLPPAAAAEVLSFAAARYPGGFAATQVFLPDRAGRFPWDADCEANWRAVQTGLFGLGRPTQEGGIPPGAPQR